MLPDETSPPKSDLKSLFEQKSVRGWWPCYMETNGKRELGVSTITQTHTPAVHQWLKSLLLLFTGEGRVDSRDCEWEGSGWKTCWKRQRWTQYEPQTGSSQVKLFCLCLTEIFHCVTPSSSDLCFLRRPETSFFWFTNPCKTCKFIVWRKFKWLFLGLILLILVLLFIGVLLYSLPVSKYSTLITSHSYEQYWSHNCLCVFFSYRTTFLWKLSNPFNENEVPLCCVHASMGITTSLTQTHSIKMFSVKCSCF